jgi:hypothetical protein
MSSSPRAREVEEAVIGAGRRQPAFERPQPEHDGVAVALQERRATKEGLELVGCAALLLLRLRELVDEPLARRGDRLEPAIVVPRQSGRPEVLLIGE